jgi:hypothetical protein
MFESIYNQFDEISNILMDKDELYRIENIDIDILLTLINFLKKFKEATNCLEASKNPTLHLVIPWFKALKEHCKISQYENEYLKQIKAKVYEKLILKYKIEDLYKLAIFFDPRMKQLKILEQNEILWIHNQIREYYFLIQIDSNNDNNDEDLYNEEIQEEPPKKLRKKISTEFTDFSQYYDSSDDENDIDEINQYLACKVSKDSDLNILKWWKDHENEYPKLSILCAYFLAIPASSASSEREFSSAGLTISEQRTNLNPETIESILIMHSALK